MKKLLILVLILVYISQIKSQDTFSICAIDTITGEVGSAGASCAYVNQGIRILSDIHPGIGVVHTQAQYEPVNQIYARNLMNQGLSPQQIIDSLVANDIYNNPGIRQYGIVDFRDDNPRSAAYTGQNCFDHKNHITGRNYSIQGNILLGQQILDSMEARFLRAEGELACRLMEALQGAKVVGADTRCMADGISSIGAFLRVAQPDDPVNNLYLEYNIPIADDGVDPIDTLQVLIDNWGGCVNNYLYSISSDLHLKVYPNPASQKVSFEFANKKHQTTISIYNIEGIQIKYFNLNGQSAINWDVSHLPKGIYIYKVTSENFSGYMGKIAVN